MSTATQARSVATGGLKQNPSAAAAAVHRDAQLHNIMSTQPDVADYIVQRLAQEGITDCFGVAGDFAFKLNDAVVRSERIRWIGCSNELDAAYAADGYARMRGCSMLMTTYAVGELSALNGVMGAKAERSCVFHVVGMPTMRNQRVGKVIHHTLGDGIFQNFANISAQAACVSAVITPDNCAHEMERVIATARAQSRPGYILVAGDFAVTPVTATDATPYPKPASGPDLAKAAQAITERIQAARSLAVLPAYTVSRFKLQRSLLALIEALGCPFAVTPMEKGVLSETHAQFAGMYMGGGSSPSVLEAVEAADLVIDAGGVNFNEINTGAYSSRLSPEKLITIDVDFVRIGNRIFNPVQLGDLFEMLVKSVPKKFGYSAPRKQAPAKPGGKPSDPITAATLYPRYRDFFKPKDLIVLESGSSESRDSSPSPSRTVRKCADSPLLGPDRLGHWGKRLEPLWPIHHRDEQSSLRGESVCTSSTATAITGLMGRLRGPSRIIFVLNNGGIHDRAGARYGSESGSTTTSPPGTIMLFSAALGCQGWFTAKANTLGELDAALDRAAA